MAEFNGKQGVWRTVGGRRIFIPDGDDLTTAMKNSGKFKNMFGKDISDQLTKNNKNVFTNSVEETKQEVQKYINDAIKKGYKEDDVYGEIHTTERNSYGTPIKSFTSAYGREINQFVGIYKDKVDYVQLSLQRGTGNTEETKTIDLQKNR